MSKVGRKGIAYQDVVRACKELEEQNEAVTIRKIIAVTGGSFSTVSEYLRRWQEVVTQFQESKALPDELITALKTAYIKMFHDERKLQEADRANERKILNETLKEVIDLESEQDRLNKEIERLNQHYGDVAAGYERRLAAAESRVVDSEKREKELNGKLEDIRQKLHQAEINVSIAETKSQEYEKQLASLKKENQKPASKS